MENIEKKDNDVILDGVNVSALRALDECFLRGERAFAKVESGDTNLTEEEERDLREYYDKLKIIARCRGISEKTSEDHQKTDSGVVKKIGTK